MIDQRTPAARRIVVASTKGGVGKSMISSHLASYAAIQGWRPTLVDCDSQRSTSDWHHMHHAQQDRLTLVRAADPMTGGAASYTSMVSPLSRCVIIDTPAGMRSHHLTAYVRNADTLLVPLQPSIVDLRATKIFLTELARLQEVKHSKLRMGLVLNRARLRTLALRDVLSQANELNIPVVGVLRDSQAYQLTATLGKSLFDLNTGGRLNDLCSDWDSVFEWLSWAEPKASSEDNSTTQSDSDTSAADQSSDDDTGHSPEHLKAAYSSNSNW